MLQKLHHTILWQFFAGYERNEINKYFNHLQMSLHRFAIYICYSMPNLNEPKNRVRSKYIVTKTLILRKAGLLFSIEYFFFQISISWCSVSILPLNMTKRIATGMTLFGMSLDPNGQTMTPLGLQRTLWNIKLSIQVHDPAAFWYWQSHVTNFTPAQSVLSVWSLVRAQIWRGIKQA